MDRLISLQAAIDAPVKMVSEGLDWIPVYHIKGLPSAQPERKNGEWTKNNSCPFCGFLPWYERDIHTLSFCPNCGADMRGEKHDAD